MYLDTKIETQDTYFFIKLVSQEVFFSKVKISLLFVDFKQIFSILILCFVLQQPGNIFFCIATHMRGKLLYEEIIFPDTCIKRELVHQEI